MRIREKRIVAWTMTLLMAFGSTGMTAFAGETDLNGFRTEVNKDINDIDNINDITNTADTTDNTDTADTTDITDYDSINGYEAPDVDIESYTGSDSGFIDEYGNDLLQSTYIPTSYDSRNANGKNCITPIKNQDPYGTCWAFAAMSTAEANLLKKGLVSKIDLSELHLAELAKLSKGVVDPIGGSTGDYTQVYESDGSLASGSDVLNYGGNNVQAILTMSRLGAEYEADAPYTTSNSIADSNLSILKSKAFDTDIKLKNAYLIGMSNQTQVKQAIIQYGAVASSYLSLSNYYGPYGGYKNATYYNPYYRTSQNHAITIVGWDDNFSKDNFIYTPSEDGAWLVKNSWGTSFGNNGYFWMSYEEDSLLNADACVYEMNTIPNHDNVYQYDGSTGTVYFRGTKFANVFTTHSAKEVLNSVSMMLYSADADYSVQIYKNLTDRTRPESGTPMLSTPVTGKATYAGYKTIDLPQGVQLSQGETFAVVISFDEIEWVAADADSTRIANTDSGTIKYEYNNEARAGQSFQWSAYSGWFDQSTNTNPANFRIKAFTTSLAQEKPLSVTASTSATSNVVGDKLTISAAGAGGSGNYSYKFIVYNTGTNTWAKLADFGASRTFTWTAGSAGNRQFYVDVKDTVSGKVVRSSVMNVKTGKSLSVTASASATRNTVGDKLTLSAAGSGGSGSYTYKFIVHNVTTGAWAKLADFGASKTLVWTAGSAGNREFYVDMKDTVSGIVVRSAVMKLNTYAKLSVSTTISAKTNTVGDKLSIKAIGAGGSGIYAFRFLVHNIDTGAWAKLQDSSYDSFTWMAGSAGKREFFVEILDLITGGVIRSNGMSVITSK